MIEGLPILCFFTIFYMYYHIPTGKGGKGKNGRFRSSKESPRGAN